MTNIAFIGLGKMGTPMVKNLLLHGHHIKVYDIAREAIGRCVEMGAIGADSVIDALEDASLVITMLQTGKQVQAVCLGPEGVFANIKKNALYIDSSSIDIDTCRNLHQQAKQAGISMLDAPVSGGVKGAEAASLTIMVGGERQDFEEGKPYLELLGKFVVHAGPAGNGQAAKICNNMILGISMIAVSEAFCLAEKLGLEAKKLFEVSSHASGQCWSLTSYCPVPGILENVPANYEYRPGFTAAMMLKDLKLSQQAAQFAGVDTELGAKATEIYQQFIDSDQGQLDFSAIIKRYE